MSIIYFINLVFCLVDFKGIFNKYLLDSILCRETTILKKRVEIYRFGKRKWNYFMSKHKSCMKCRLNFLKDFSRLHMHEKTLNHDGSSCHRHITQDRCNAFYKHSQIKKITVYINLICEKQLI